MNTLLFPTETTQQQNSENGFISKCRFLFELKLFENDPLEMENEFNRLSKLNI